jgi:hypothetical protein
MLPEIFISKEVALPDNDQWQNRFDVKSKSSDRLYTVAQNKKKKYWACSCPGWKRWRKCEHLKEIGLPCNVQPYEVNLIIH